MFENIFSKAKKRKVNQENHELSGKIIADYREKNSLVLSELSVLGIQTEIRNLKVADFIIGNIGIERKTASDFISSMINKRLFRQLEEIKQFPNHFLILEGNLEETNFTNQNAVKGFLLSIIIDYKVPILFSKNEKETANYLYLLAKKSKSSASIRANKIPLNKKQQLQYILEGFPGIGPKTSEKLLKQYQTLNNIFLSPIEGLNKLIGKKSQIFKILNEKF